MNSPLAIDFCILTRVENKIGVAALLRVEVERDQTNRVFVVARAKVLVDRVITNSFFDVLLELCAVFLEIELHDVS